MPQLVLLAGVVILSGCAAVLVDRDESWPDGVPPRAYYERVWNSDPRLRDLQPREQYLAWVLRFYSGTFLVPGWTRRQAEIVACLTPDQARLAEPDLELLGQVISSEWSKHDSIRRISSRTLAIWGEVLAEARDGGRLTPALDRIRDDVRGLLQGDLEPSAITHSRYHALALTQRFVR